MRRVAASALLLVTPLPSRAGALPGPKRRHGASTRPETRHQDAGKLPAVALATMSAEPRPFSRRGVLVLLMAGLCTLLVAVGRGVTAGYPESGTTTGKASASLKFSARRSMYSEPAKPAEVLPPPPPPARRIVLEAPDPEAEDLDDGGVPVFGEFLATFPTETLEAMCADAFVAAECVRAVEDAGRTAGKKAALIKLLRSSFEEGRPGRSPPPPRARSPPSPPAAEGALIGEYLGIFSTGTLRRMCEGMEWAPRFGFENLREENPNLRVWKKSYCDAEWGGAGGDQGTAAGDAAAKGRMVEIVQTHLEEKYIEFLERAPPESVHRQLDASPGPERLDAVSAAASDPPPAPPIAPGGEMYSIVETKITVSGDCSFDQADQAAATASLAASLSVDESAITLAYKCRETTAAPNECDCSSEETGCESNGVSLSRNGKGSGVDHCGCFYLDVQKRTICYTAGFCASASESSYYKGATWRTCDADSPNGDSVEPAIKLTVSIRVPPEDVTRVVDELTSLSTLGGADIIKIGKTTTTTVSTLSLIHISDPTRQESLSRIPSSA